MPTMPMSQIQPARYVITCKGLTLAPGVGAKDSEITGFTALLMMSKPV